MPGLIFLFTGLLACVGAVPGGRALALFGACTATTHLFSALTHVYPDSKRLEKLDHLGIVVLIVGTPFTALLVRRW